MVHIDQLAESFQKDSEIKIVKNLSPGRDIICIAECEDCGKFLVTSADFISVFFIPDAEFLVGITLCIYCERPVTDSDMSYKLTKSLVTKGVKAFNFLTGEIYDN